MSGRHRLKRNAGSANGVRRMKCRPRMSCRLVRRVHIRNVGFNLVGSFHPDRVPSHRKHAGKDQVRGTNSLTRMTLLAIGILALTTAACTVSSAPKAVDASHAAAIRNAAERPKVPDAPQNVMALAIGPGVMVVWSPPPSNGGASITKYEVIPSSGPPLTVAGPRTTATFTGLPHGATYTFTVRATNASGVGPLSLPSSVVNL